MNSTKIMLCVVVIVTGVIFASPISANGGEPSCTNPNRHGTYGVIVYPGYYDGIVTRFCVGDAEKTHDEMVVQLFNRTLPQHSTGLSWWQTTEGIVAKVQEDIDSLNEQVVACSKTAARPQDC